jgi:hypothetical protein
MKNQSEENVKQLLAEARNQISSNNPAKSLQVCMHVFQALQVSLVDPFLSQFPASLHCLIDAPLLFTPHPQFLLAALNLLGNSNQAYDAVASVRSALTSLDISVSQGTDQLAALLSRLEIDSTTTKTTTPAMMMTNSDHSNNNNSNITFPSLSSQYQSHHMDIEHQQQQHVDKEKQTSSTKEAVLVPDAESYMCPVCVGVFALSRREHHQLWCQPS